MSQPLKERARSGRPAQSGNGQGNHAEPIISYEVGDDPEAVPVRVAWARAMRFCRALTKGSTAEVKEKGTGRVLYTYKYRGVDDVVTLAGMAFRQFGIMVLPVDIQTEYRPAGQMMTCFATVTYEVSALGEGSFRGTVKSEGIDNADKATVKAEQQAYRVFLTTALSLPTYDPKLDSDATPVLRPEPPGPFAIRDEILDPKTSLARLQALKSEFKRDADLAATLVPVGDGEERLWDLLTRVGKAREAERERERAEAERNRTAALAAQVDAPVDPPDGA